MRLNLRFAMLAALVLAIGASCPATGADSSDLETAVKAADILNFGRFIEWPAHLNSGPILRICVTGRGDLAAALRESVEGKSIGGRAVTVTGVAASGAADCCDILLIERSELRHARAIVQGLTGKPVLTVCDDPSGIAAGVMVVFRLAGETVRFEINQEAAGQAGLKISSQLLKVAIPASGAR